MKKIISNDLGRNVLAFMMVLVFIGTLSAMITENSFAKDKSLSSKNFASLIKKSTKNLKSMETKAVASGYGIEVSISKNITKGTIRVKATATSGDNVIGMFISKGNTSDFVYKNPDLYQRTVDKTVSVKDASPGFFNVVVYTQKSFNNGEDAAFIQTDIGINTQKPTYKGVFNVYSKVLNFYPYTASFVNASQPLYLEYKPVKSKKWKRSGYMKRDSIKLGDQQGFKIKGLKANTKYNTRIRYGVKATKFDGSTGTIYGPTFGTGTYKTGKAKKPAVKSIKIKAVKKKFHKNRVAGHYEWTGYHYIWIKPYTEKFWTCKLKVTVKLKKKPGTKGIVVGGKYLKGNKKKYTTIVTPYPNYYTKKPPKGLKKVKITVRSYQSKKYGGLSPVKTKKCKIK